MKKLFPLYVWLVGAVLLSCSTNDDSITSENKEWQTLSFATKLGGDIELIEGFDDESTRSLFVGGQTGSRFSRMWDDSDIAQVYKDGVFVGTLVPNVTGSEYTTLAGTLEGSYAVGDEITLYMPSPDLDYTGQDGTVGNMSKYFDFMTKTIKVASINGSTITTEEATFGSRQGYLLLKFRDEDNKLLHVKQLVLHAPSGQVVATRSMDGTTVYTDELVINPPKVHSSVDDYPVDIYVAVLNDNSAKEAYSFTVTTDDGKIYKSVSPMNGKLNLGKLAQARHAVYCTTVDVDAQTSIVPPESDTPDVEQVTL